VTPAAPTARRSPPRPLPSSDHQPPAATESVVELRALGPVEAVVDGRVVDLGAPKQRALLALLASRVGQPVTVDVMLEALWADHPPPSAVTSLQAYVANLRRILEPHRQPRTPASVLRTCPRGYLLDARAVDMDVHRFDERAAAGRQAWDGGDPHEAVRQFDAGLALWRGQAYAEVADATCVASEVARLEEMRLSIVEARCAALLAIGAHEVAVAQLEAFIQAHPLREYGCELLSLALYRSGRQADALRVLRGIHRRLAEELGIDPRPALRQLEREILNQSPSLDWQPVATVATTMTTTPRTPQHIRPADPPPLSRIDRDILVGREAPLRELVDALATVRTGRGRVVVVSGEPGIGKTSLLRRFAEIAGVPVLWGTCPEHVTAPPLWPWEHVLRAATASVPRCSTPRPVADLIAGEGPQPIQPAATLRRFEAIVDYLTDAARAEPLAIVLDHAHRADPASLRLLAHLADSVPASRILLVVSYRSGEAATMAQTFAALARAGMTRVDLTGLTVEDTRALTSALVDCDVSERTAEGLWARTDGNPFFVRELVKLLAAEHGVDKPDAGPVPEPVRDVVLQRVGRLPRPVSELLYVAAVAGREFDVDVVAAAASLDIDAALDAIDVAIAAGLLEEDRQRLGWFSFTSAMVAETLYESTGRLRRARVHRRIAEAAAGAWRGAPERQADIARHRLLGGDFRDEAEPQSTT
jgi:DNA-binding SARP family transcriptional activator